LTGKTIAQSEQAISISPARVARDSGIAANGLTQKNALWCASFEGLGTSQLSLAWQLGVECV